MAGMENWSRWSVQHHDLSPLLRATLLHAWLTHIHPFVDGNGRISRAITNLELVRAGYPPIIIRRNQDRDRYIGALALSDEAGDIAGFLDLVVDRFEGALVGLESAAREVEGYSAVTVQLRRAQERRLEVWNASVELLFRVMIEKLTTVVEATGGEVKAQPFRESLTLDEYIHLCEGVPVSKSWAFVVGVVVPGLDAVQRLAWIGFRSPELRRLMGLKGVAAPSLFWSKPNPQGYPPWILCSDDAPGAVEMSITPGAGDDWQILRQGVQHESVTTTDLAHQICEGFSDLLARRSR